MGYSIDPIFANCYPDTTVLINKFDIRDEEKLNEVESVLASVRYAEWLNAPKADSFDFEHYKAIHHFLFSDLYDWAGQMRTVNISKKGTKFTPDEKHYTALEELIMTQMRNQLAQSENITYWIEDSEIGEDFITLNANQNFYFKEKGNLVLVYNKYEVSPGSMGCPEFELLPEEYMEYMNPSIAELFGQE